MTWIQDVMAQTEEAETPRSFIYWGALAAISAVVKKNVYLDKFIYKLYPNIYVMLVARSGMRKSFPVTLAKSLVSKVNNTRVIAGRNSIQAVIQALSSSYTQEGKSADKTILKDAAGFLVSGEFGNFLIQDPGASTILTDLYDTHANEEWKNSLKGEGTSVLKDVCLTLLGASNDTLLKEALPISAYQGGFIARTLMIQEDKRSRKNPLTEAPKVRLDIDYLSKYLIGISKLSGPFIYSPDAKDFYEEWYKSYNPEDSDDPSGTADRLHDQILKVSMLISLSKRPDLVLEASDIKEAVDHCTFFAKNIERLSVATGKSDLGDQTTIVMQELISRATVGFRITRSALLKKYYTHFTASDLDKIIDTLEQATAVETIRIDNNERIYKLSDAFIEKYKKVHQR